MITALLLVAVGSWGAAGALPPAPPRQTPYQQDLIRNISKTAEVAAVKWEPELLKVFDSDELREDLKTCCPEIATLPAEQLLAMLQREVQFSELTHNFSPFSTNRFHDLSVALMQNTTYLYNLWQLSYLFYHDMTAGNIEDTAETQLMGFEPFTGRDPTTGKGVPANYLEASQRPLYTVLNLHRVALGNPTFGAMSFILSNRVVQDMALAYPVDTGMWMMGCGKVTPPPFPHKGNCSFPMKLNCTGFEDMGMQLGTLDHITHTLLANHILLNGWNCTDHTLGRVFARLFSTRPNALAEKETEMHVMSFIEVDLAGSVPWPQGVKHVVMNFTEAFGTKNGTVVQELCAKGGRALSWTVNDLPVPFAAATPQYTPPLSSRVVDPVVGVVNITKGSVEAFRGLWSEVAEKRDGADAKQWAEWWGRLLESQAVTIPARAIDCADPDCIGVDPTTRECVCYKY